jgi:hypothetical protein
MKSVTETAIVTNVVATETVKRGPGRPKTKVTLKRVVLLEGKPVGRGRPAKGSSSKRTYVFIPVDETYDAAQHGSGSRYRAGLNQSKTPIKRVNIGSYRKLVNLPATAPVVTPAADADGGVLVDTAAKVVSVGDKF